MTTKKLVITIEDLFTVNPLTRTQEYFFKAWQHHPIHVCHGFAGTGKTFISMYRALEDVLGKNRKYKKVVVVRSAVAARDIGAMPGDLEEKSAVYELPYEDICEALFTKEQVYTRLKEQGKLKFALTSYVRGITFDNSIIIVDEIQNMNYQELYSVMTRIGEDSKIVFCGDFRQSDIRDSGLHKFLNVLSYMNNVAFHEFQEQDIVRSKIVKEFIIAESKYEE